MKKYPLILLMTTILLPLMQLLAQQPDSLFIPKVYTALKTTMSPAIDGVAEAEVWGEIPFTEAFEDIEGVTSPKWLTRVKMAWDKDHFYVLAVLEDPHVWATLKQRDTVIFYNNDFEIFLDPDGDTFNYGEIEVNALNTVWDLLLGKPYRNSGIVADHWNISGLHTGVKINGTLNDASDEDGGWTLEMAIPFDALSEIGGSLPEHASFWRVNFSRVHWDHDLEDGRYSKKRKPDGELAPEYNWVWSPQQVINMHQPERWGYVYFSDKAEVSFSGKDLPADELIKHQLYEVYRDYYRKWTAGEFPAAPMPDFTVGGVLIQPHLEVHQSGWNLWVESPFSGKLLIIREDGEFTEKLKN